MSDTTLINDVSINGNEGLTPDALSETLQDNTINALGIDASSRTIWVNGQPYGNAYVNIKDDNTLEAPIGAEIFNDFEHNVAAGEYSHAEGFGTTAAGEYSHASGYNTTASGKSSFALGQDNEAISENSVAMGNNNIAGLKGFYYKYITLKAGGNTKLANVYVSKTQVSNPTIDTNSGASFKDTSIKPQNYWAVGDIISIVNDAKYDDIATVKQIKDGLVQIEWLDGKSPFSTVKPESDLSSEDYSIYCLDKPTQGISDLGKCSFVNGSDNKAINVYTEVSGKGNVAKGKFAKLWGKNNIGGYNTTTFGTNNVNLTDNSLVNGTNNVNEGNNSVIHGNANKNYGKRAFVTGNENITNNENEVAFGKYNKSIEGSTIFSIGVGTSDNNRKNAFEVDSDGSSHFTGDTTIASTLGVDSNTTIGGTLGVTGAAHFETKPTVTNGTISNDPVVLESEFNSAKESLEDKISEEKQAREAADTALGTRIDTEKQAREAADTALGTRIDNEKQAREAADTALDEKIVIVPGDYANSGVLRGEYEGYSNKAISQTSLALGAASTAGLKGWYYSKIEFGINPVITLSDKQPYVLLGNLVGGAWSSGTANISVGDKVSIVNNAKYDYCGEVQSVSGNKVTLKSSLPFDTLDIGTIAVNNPDDWSIYLPDKESVGIIDFGGGALAEGVNTKSTNIGSHSEGIQTHAYGQYSHTEGFKTIAGYAAHAEGKETIASGQGAHAEGQDNTSEGNVSHTEGRGNYAQSSRGHAEGENNYVGNTDRTNPEPTNTSNKGFAAHVEGQANTVLGNSAHAEGLQNKAIGNNSHAEGESTNASGQAAHTEGKGTSTGYILDGTTYIGTNSHAEGEGTIAARGSHAEGMNTKAYGWQSHAEGKGTEASANFAHAEGEGTIASASRTHAEGYGAQAISQAAHAEGINTIAGKSVDSEGGIVLPTVSTTTNPGYFSHAEGNGTLAYGNSSHAQNKGTQALANYSHAGGLSCMTETAATYSFVHGQNLTCGTKNCFMIGTYNDLSVTDEKLFVIGGGTKESDRKNLLEIDKNGLVNFKSYGKYDAICGSGETTTVFHNDNKTYDDDTYQTITENTSFIHLYPNTKLYFYIIGWDEGFSIYLHLPNKYNSDTILYYNALLSYYAPNGSSVSVNNIYMYTVDDEGLTEKIDFCTTSNIVFPDQSDDYTTHVELLIELTLNEHMYSLTTYDATLYSVKLINVY